MRASRNWRPSLRGKPTTLDQRISLRWEWWAPRLPRAQHGLLRPRHYRYYERALHNGLSEQLIAGSGIDDPRLSEESQLHLMELHQDADGRAATFE